jgi:rRNA maturation protein Nop10
MPSLLFTCPATRKKATTGIETDAQSLQSCWKFTLHVKCPHCGATHDIPVRQTYVNNALDDAVARLGGAASLAAR